MSAHALYPQRPPVGDWAEHAACKGARVHYPHHGALQAVAAAKALCAVCPVSQECLRHAIDTDEPDGIWGGLTASERRRITPARGRLKPINHGTSGGAQTHRKRGEKPCSDCLAAWNQAVRFYKRRGVS